jgi:hypothetical protein
MRRERVWHTASGREIVWYRRINADDDEGLFNVARAAAFFAALVLGGIAAAVGARHLGEPWRAVLCVVCVATGAFCLVVVIALGVALTRLRRVIRIIKPHIDDDVS